MVETIFLDCDNSTNIVPLRFGDFAFRAEPGEFREQSILCGFKRRFNAVFSDQQLSLLIRARAKGENVELVARGVVNQVKCPACTQRLTH
jgi:hypothetical protein